MTKLTPKDYGFANAIFESVQASVDPFTICTVAACTAKVLIEDGFVAKDVDTEALAESLARVPEFLYGAYVEDKFKNTEA